MRTSSPVPASCPADGAQIIAGDGGARFAHTALADGDELDVGDLTLRALATPGHTFEHLSYLLLDGPRRSRCSPAGRCWSVPRAAPIWPAPSTPTS
jgi:hypothetical protein